MRGRKILMQAGESRLILFHSETGAYFTLDEIGTMVWGLCDGTHSVSEIINRLLSQYDAPLESIQMDLMELLQEFASKKLLLARAA